MWPGCKGALDALGLDGTNRLDIVLMQLVKLLRDGELVRMSKRTGKAIALHDLLDEVPRGRRPLLLQRPSPTPRWSLTWASPSGRTARTPSTMCSTPTPASAPCIHNLAAEGHDRPERRHRTPRS